MKEAVIVFMLVLMVLVLVLSAVLLFVIIIQELGDALRKRRNRKR